MDFFNSFFQNVKDKITSPFFGTLTFILIIHHWEFWYTLFNFDKDCLLPEKIAILQRVGRNEFSWKNISCDVILAIVITVVGFIVVFGTRSLSLFFDHKAMPWITGKIIDKNVVLRSVHEDVVKERDEYSDKYEEQRKNVRILSKNFDEQTLQIQEKDKQFIAETERVNHITEQNTRHYELSNELKDDLETAEREIKLLEKNVNDGEVKFQQATKRIAELSLDANFLNLLLLGSHNQDFWKHLVKWPHSILETLNEIKSANDWDRVIMALSDVAIKKKNIPDNDKKILANYGLMSPYSSSLTILGMFIYNNRSLLHKLNIG